MFEGIINWINRFKRNWYEFTGFEKLSLVLTCLYVIISFFAFCVAVLAIINSNHSLDISNANSKNISDYTMKSQANFNKNAAAKQFSIEINSLSEKIGGYDKYYLSNSDLILESPYTDIEHSNDIVLRVTDRNNITPYFLEFYNGNITVLKYEVIPIYINENYSVNYKISPISSSPKLINATLGAPLIPPQFYDEHGMYFTYVRDVSNFNNTTANDLYNFYDRVITANAEREYIQKYVDSNSNTIPLSGSYFTDYMNLRYNIMNISYTIPRSSEELDNETK